jgi:hypothetical protein
VSSAECGAEEGAAGAEEEEEEEEEEEAAAETSSSSLSTESLRGLSLCATAAAAALREATLA